MTHQAPFPPPADDSGMTDDGTANREGRIGRAMHDGLKSKNVRIHQKRTSIRLEPSMWNALNDIAMREGCSIHDLCGAVHDLKDRETSFTSSLRSFMIEYYRSSPQINTRVVQVQEKLKENRERRKA